ncbi:hypothetical protein [Halosimplex amylolyticum]|uniref:hypothetical protein n=1 Tax=Halosimplex amylolyticum TaxID=3396616 RepID=UPI003F56A001
MEKNQDYLTMIRGSTSWKFYIDSEIELSNEVPDRTAAVMERIFATLGRDIAPIVLKLGVASLPSQTPIDEAFSEAEPVLDSNGTIKNCHGITYQEYAERVAEIATEDDRVLHVSKVATESTCVKVYLRSGMQTIDATESEYFRNDRSDVDQVPDHAPLSFSVIHQSSKYRPGGKLAGDSVYRITIGTDSDIWFGDTEIAQINRARLSKLLHEINDTFPVVARDFSVGEMDRYTDADPSVVFEYDGPPAEELIREYRIDWVESELVETAAQYDEAGETVFEVTSDAPTVQTEELRKRIEAYVDHEREQGNAPQADLLRIVRTDGTQLEAKLTDDTLEWVDDESDKV